jgi:adenosylhomocysteine nucleosidase
MSRVAIVAAMEREVRLLVKCWRFSDQEHGGRRLRFYEKDDATLVCAGIGREAARRAAEAIIALYSPEVIYSAGFAGALDSDLKVGDLVQPQRVVNAGDGSSVELTGGRGVLVSFGSVASPAQKSKLREAFAAQAVDMEAAAVAQAAEARGIRFAVVKAISDESDFTFPELDRFVEADGQFAQWRFAIFAAVHPWLWPQAARLARSSRIAAIALCRRLQEVSSKDFIAGSDTCGKTSGMIHL